MHRILSIAAIVGFLSTGASADWMSSWGDGISGGGRSGRSRGVRDSHERH